MTPQQKIARIVEWLDRPARCSDEMKIGVVVPGLEEEITAGDLRELHRLVTVATEPATGAHICRVRFCMDCGANLTHEKQR
jgi:hypothetical protein